MNVTEPFVLKRDVLLIPCSELSDDVRARLAFEDGDYTLSVRHGRALAQVIDAETAALLALFREPRTIADAILENSRAFHRDAEERFEELLPHLGDFVEKRILVQAGSDDEKEIRPLFDAGTDFGAWKIIRCASLIDDSEIYQLRDGANVAALKIARAGTRRLRTMFENEAAILRRLDGSGIAPRLIDAGVHDERPYLVIDWIGGVHAGVAAAQRRHDRAALIDLCASIAAAYAELHARGVLHADVHPRNVLAGDNVVLLDFGYSCVIGEPPRVGRGGIYDYFEPEYVRDKVPASPAGEQYAVAALLYTLLAGKPYLDFRLERDEIERQIVEEPPVPFASRGIPPWPAVEAILFRALEKDPARRHGSMAEMAALLAAERDAAAQQSLSKPLSAEAAAFLETTLRSMMRGGAMYAGGYTAAPMASINYGCAGAAVGLLRIAETRDDPALLALADHWRWRAEAMLGDERAYYGVDRELSRDSLGDVSPYHTEAGIHAAAAMVAAAMGDVHSQRRAVAAFVRASSRPCLNLDLTLGRSSSLLGATLLMELGGEESAALRAFGSETLTAIWSVLDARPPIAATNNPHLGLAHGWTGYLYAALRWCAASGDPLPTRLPERLHELAALRIAKGRGAYWPRTLDATPPALMPSWCNGAAGQVFLFTLAHRILGDDEWLRLAELAAWNEWDEPRGASNLCCGTAGRAYALLNLYKHSGETAWLSRARHLANHAASAASATSQRENSLWKGELGVAVLIADLASPENARMPFFE